MKLFVSIFLALLLSGFSNQHDAVVELVCMKTHKASNTCYFNFKVDSVKYCYTDVGCRQVKKRDQLVQKVKEGRLALSRDWKFECPDTED